MGLDWVPLPKPQPEYSGEYEILFGQVFKGHKPPEPSWIKRVLGKVPTPEQLGQKLMAIPATTPYETLNAPRIGFHERANAWLKENYESDGLRKDLLEKPFAEVLKECHGNYVLDVLPEQDGIPCYICTPGYSEPFWFRAKFLDDCEDILGKQLFNEAWESKLAPELAEYGQKLMKVAEDYAREHSVEHVLNQYKYEWEEDQPATKAHILASAAKWCMYWGSRGHGVQAYF